MKKYLRGQINISVIFGVLLLIMIVVVGILGVYSNLTQTRTSSTKASERRVGYQQVSFDAFPLAVLEPVEGGIVSSRALVVRGNTKPNADVLINDKEAKADAAGNFSLLVILGEDDDSVQVSATDETGAVVEKEVTFMVNAAN